VSSHKEARWQGTAPAPGSSLPERDEDGDSWHKGTALPEREEMPTCTDAHSEEEAAMVDGGTKVQMPISRRAHSRPPSDANPCHRQRWEDEATCLRRSRCMPMHPSLSCTCLRRGEGRGQGTAPGSRNRETHISMKKGMMQIMDTEDGSRREKEKEMEMEREGSVWKEACWVVGMQP
jgi:hypothetical protein